MADSSKPSPKKRSVATKPVTEVLRYKKGQRALCYGCGQTVKVEDLGGLVKVAKDAIAFTHDSLPCLLAFSELTKVTDLQPSDDPSQDNGHSKAQE